MSYFRIYLTFSTTHVQNLYCACAICDHHTVHWLRFMISNNSCLVHVSPNSVIFEDIRDFLLRMCDISQNYIHWLAYLISINSYFLYVGPKSPILGDN